MSEIKGYRDLMVWEKAHKLTLEVYQITKRFPAEEKYSLVQQIRKSAASVPTNIAEGFERFSKKEYIQFLYISRGSLSETDYHLQLSFDLGYIKDNDLIQLQGLIVEIGRMINGLINALRKSC